MNSDSPHHSCHRSVNPTRSPWAVQKTCFLQGRWTVVITWEVTTQCYTKVGKKHGISVRNVQSLKIISFWRFFSARETVRLYLVFYLIVWFEETCFPPYARLLLKHHIPTCEQTINVQYKYLFTLTDDYNTTLFFFLLILARRIFSWIFTFKLLSIYTVFASCKHHKADSYYFYSLFILLDLTREFHLSLRI